MSQSELFRSAGKISRLPSNIESEFVPDWQEENVFFTIG